MRLDFVLREGGPGAVRHLNLRLRPERGRARQFASVTRVRVTGFHSRGTVTPMEVVEQGPYLRS